jgi:hypothetical protein
MSNIKASEERVPSISGMKHIKSTKTEKKDEKKEQGIR